MTQLAIGSPFALIGPGQTLTLETPGAGVQLGNSDPYFAILQNDSSLQLLWSTGASSGSIQAWAASVVEVGPASPSGSGAGPQTITITTQGYGSGNLTVSWGVGDEPVPGTYPSTSGVSASAIAAQADILVLTAPLIGGMFNVATMNIPPGALGLFIVNQGTNALEGLKVVGSATVNEYASFLSIAPNQGAYLPYNSTNDPVATIAGVAGGATILVVYAMYSSPGTLISSGIGASYAPQYVEQVGGQWPNPAAPNEATIQPLEVDQFGRLIPFVPNTASGLVTTATVIAVPSAGGNYLFGADAISSSATALVTLSANGGVMGVLQIGAAGAGTPDHIELNGFRAITAVTAIYTGTGTQVLIRYVAGP